MSQHSYCPLALALHSDHCILWSARCHSFFYGSTLKFSDFELQEAYKSYSSQSLPSYSTPQWAPILTQALLFQTSLFSYPWRSQGKCPRNSRGFHLRRGLSRPKRSGGFLLSRHLACRSQQVIHALLRTLQLPGDDNASRALCKSPPSYWNHK